MEADKSQDLQGESASWRPRRACGIVSVWRSPGQEEAVFQFESKAGQSRYPSFKAVRQEEFSFTWGRVTFCCIQAFNWLREAHPTLGRTVTQATSLNVNLIQNPQRNTQNNVGPFIRVPHDPVKLTHKLTLTVGVKNTWRISRWIFSTWGSFSQRFGWLVPDVLSWSSHLSCETHTIYWYFLFSLSNILTVLFNITDDFPVDTVSVFNLYFRTFKASTCSYLLRWFAVLDIHS